MALLEHRRSTQGEHHATVEALVYVEVRNSNKFSLVDKVHATIYIEILDTVDGLRG